MIIDTNDKNSITGFVIHIINDDQSDATMQAELQANRLCNLLTLKSNTIVECNQPSISSVEDNKITIFNTLSCGVSVYLGYDLNLNDQLTRSLIYHDSKTNQHLYNYHNGFKAFQERDFSIAIKELFMIVENQDFPDLKKYRALRNAVSHEKLDDMNTILELNKLGITIQKGGYLDTNSPPITKILEQEARNLLNFVKPFVGNELKI